MSMTSHNRNYRGWSLIEEAKLVEALVNMVNIPGFKDSNGFKTKYLQHLEQKLKETLPDSGILGKPHIESKMKTLRRDLQVVLDMLSSGFALNNDTKYLEATPAVWNSYIKSHKEAAKFKNKPFPHYEDLSIVFEHDRVQGNKARNPIHTEVEANLEEETQKSDYDYYDDDDFIIKHANVQVEENSSSPSRKRKDRVDHLGEGLNDVVNVLCDTIHKAATTLSRDLDFKVDLRKKKAMITSEIMKMQSLTQLRKFRSIKKIRSESEYVEIFWDLDEEYREDWVRYILEE